MGRSIEVIESKMFEGVVADELVALLGDAVAERGSCSFVLAGGKTPAEIYRTLAHPPRVGDVPWEQVKLFWGDERWVSYEDDQSNFRMVKETLLRDLPAPGPKVFGVETNLESPAAGAVAYERTIRRELGVPEGELPAFDVVLLGMGDDGHFASIFPGSPLVNEQSSTICFPAAHPETKQMRVTISANALLNARRILFAVKGAGKAEMVERVVRGKESPAELPVMLFKEVEDRVSWFLDTPAAARIHGSLGR
jgi:6-phosphogluconolactonase